MHCDFPIYSRITLEFLCTLEINLFKVPDESSLRGLQLKTTCTLSFRMLTLTTNFRYSPYGIFCTCLLMGRAMSPKLLARTNYGLKLLGRPLILRRVSMPLTFRTSFLGTYIKCWHTICFLKVIAQGMLPLKSCTSPHAMVNGYYVNNVIILVKQLSLNANSPIGDK